MITNMLHSLEAVAEEGMTKFRAELAKHKAALDDDFTAAIEAAAVLTPAERTLLADLVTRAVDYFAKQPVPSSAPAPADPAPVTDAPASSGTPIGDAAAAAVAAGPVHDDAAPVT